MMTFPSVASPCLSGLLYRAAATLNSCVVSADTLQSILDDNAISLETRLPIRGLEKSITSLADFASGALFSALGASILAAYDAVQSESNLSDTRLNLIAAAKYKDYTVQAVFDILVCETLLKRHTNLPSVSYADVAADWRDRLDPVDSALLQPLLVESMQNFLSASKLLLPASHGVVTRASQTVASKEESSVYDASHGVFANMAPRFSILPLALPTSTMKTRPAKSTGSNQDAFKKDSSSNSQQTFAISKALGDLTSNIGDLGSNFGTQFGALGDNLNTFGGTLGDLTRQNLGTLSEMGASIVGSSIGNFGSSLASLGAISITGASNNTAGNSSTTKEPIAEERNYSEITSAAF